MGLVELVKSRIQGPPSVDAAKFRKSRPKRSLEVSVERQEDGSCVLQIPFELQSRSLAGRLSKWMKAPAMKKFELEPIGAFVWDQCDGKSSFDSISRKIRDRYKMNRLESDASLAAFLQMLGRRSLITLEGMDY